MEEDILWEDKKHLLAWPLSFTKYTVVYNKLHVEKGIVNTSYDEVMLYRVVDCRCTVNLIQRLCNTGNVILYTIDKNSPIVVLESVKDPLKVKDFLSELCLKERRANHVIEVM